MISSVNPSIAALTSVKLSAQPIKKLDSDLTVSKAAFSHVKDKVEAVSTFSANKLGGTKEPPVDPKLFDRFKEYFSSGDLRADIDGNNTLDTRDYLAFFNKINSGENPFLDNDSPFNPNEKLLEKMKAYFESGDLRADIDGNKTLDSRDFIAFFNKLSAGENPFLKAGDNFTPPDAPSPKGLSADATKVSPDLSTYGAAGNANVSNVQPKQLLDIIG